MDVWRDQDEGALHLRGHLGVTTVANVRAALHDAVDAGEGDFVVVLRHAEVADATGIGLFVGLHRHAGRVGRRLVLRDVSPRCQQLLVTMGLHRILNVEPVSLTA
jgi:anti-anti-sigma factor